MKTLLSSILLVSTFITSPANACDMMMPEGFHEFATFGEKGIYLSHYPMFGSIHSYQIMLRADFSLNGKNVNDQFFAAKKMNPNAAFSTSPVRADGDEAYAVLPDYAVVGARFQARIHFDNRGRDVTAMKEVTVEIKEVILNRLMNQPKVGAVAPSDLAYFYFGNEAEAYLVHQMYWNPDFDQVVQVKPLDKGLISQCASSSGSPILFTMRDRKNNEKFRLKTGETNEATAACAASVSFKALSEMHEEQMSIQH